MNEICEQCKICARYTNLNGYGVCYSDKQKPCNDYCTEERLEKEIQDFYNKLGMFTGD